MNQVMKDKQTAEAKSGVPAKPRLTTSAMIASLAAEGQATRPAPFGHALAELGVAPGASSTDNNSVTQNK